MQTKSHQRKIIEQHAAANDLTRFCWFVAIYQAGKESTIALHNGNIPIVPAVLWPDKGNHQEQAELSRLLAEMMAKSMRRHNKEVKTAELQPALVTYKHLADQGFGWEEWQIQETILDSVCPHCGMINADRCCADWQPKRKPRRKQHGPPVL